MSNKNAIMILVVEDSSTQAAQLKHLLEIHNYTVKVANDGSRAMDMLVKLKPSLVISDIMMPVMNGYKLCENIKSERTTADIPVILLTSLSDPEEVIDGLSCGADKFITKPYNKDFLLSSIEKLLEEKIIPVSDGDKLSLEINYDGKKRRIHIEPQKMVNLLISIYQGTIHKNSELIKVQDELNKLNEILEEIVEERTSQLIIANKELVYQNNEKGKRAAELLLANKELAFQNCEKEKRANELLIAIKERQEANEYLENLLNYANAPIIVWDTKYKITRFNKAFESITGRTEKEVTGKSIKILFPPASSKSSMELIKSTVAGERLDVTEIKIMHTDRSERILLWNSANIMSDDGKTHLATIAQGHDITRRKKAEEILINNEKNLKILLESLPQLFWTCRADGPCDYLSNQWVEYTGIPEARQLGYLWLDQLHPDDKEIIISTWAEKVKTQASFDIEFRIRRNDGIYHWFKTRAVPLRDTEGNITRWLGSNTDIDEIKNATIQLSNFSKELEQTVLERTELLESANKELEAFSYSVSHDLRAPLRHIGGFIDLLTISNSAKLDEEGLRCLKIISDSSVEMGNLIDALLAFSRLGRADIRLSEIDSKSMVTSVLKSFTEELKGRKVKLNIGDLPDAMGDENLVRQVWVNLISNALKYSRKVENAVIDIGGKTEDDKALYYIKDNGAGFDMKYRDKLFVVFQRLHKEKDFEGIGIGLANVNRIVMRHGGNCRAEGEVGKGATFYFSLPSLTS